MLDVERPGEYEFNLEKLMTSTNAIVERSPASFPDGANQTLEAIYTAAKKYREYLDPVYFTGKVFIEFSFCYLLTAARWRYSRQCLDDESWSN